MYKIFRNIAVFITILLLCVWMFPILISFATTKIFMPGEKPQGILSQGSFYVAVTNENKERPFQLIPFYEISPASHFYMGKEKSLKIKIDEISYENYYLLDWVDGNPVIETVKGDDDYEFISKYQIKDRHVIPLTNRVWGLNDLFPGVGGAIIFSPLLFCFLQWVIPDDSLASKVIDIFCFCILFCFVVLIMYL